MTINLQNERGQLDLSRIRDEDVALLDEPRKIAIHNVISCVMARIKAEQALSAGNVRVRIAMEAEEQAKVFIPKPPSFQEIHAASVSAYRK